jgi:hypothetical protein
VPDLDSGDVGDRVKGSRRSIKRNPKIPRPRLEDLMLWSDRHGATHSREGTITKPTMGFVLPLWPERKAAQRVFFAKSFRIQALLTTPLELVH